VITSKKKKKILRSSQGGTLGLASSLVKKKKIGRKILKCLLREDEMGGLIRK
jgi:hypothetical protein